MRAVVAGIVAAVVLAAPAAADNYGGLTRKEERQVEQIITKRFGRYARTAICIARAESGLNPRAANWRDVNGGSHGLFQINGLWRRTFQWSRIYDPHYNALAAYRLSRGGTNWGPWTTRWRCT